MIRRLIILLLIVGCDNSTESNKHGCLDGQATNYDATASIDNNTCTYVDSCGVIDIDTTNDCVQDCAGVWGGNDLTCIDCAGISNGTATFDICGNCIGGTTGLVDGDTDSDGICNDLQGTVSDIEGNTYKTIEIGNQNWMAENLRVTHLSNGSEIPTGYSDAGWTGLTSGAYSNNYNNEFMSVYGNLYNWYAVDDSRGLCMEGWHVPSDDEWKTLELYLGMCVGSVGEEFYHDGYVQDGCVDDIGLRGNDSGVGGKMKESGHIHWEYTSEEATQQATNESGFTAIPAGQRTDFFCCGNKWAYFGSSTEFDSENYLYRVLRWNSSYVSRNKIIKQAGFSIRCIKN